MRFYEQLPGLQHAITLEDRSVAFYWVGGYGKQLLGIWDTGSAPVQVQGHFAFGATIDFVIAAPAWLRSLGITPLSIARTETDEAVVLAWMPAVSIYFTDPDGNLLEYIAMLDDAPAPERGVMPWSQWQTSK